MQSHSYLLLLPLSAIAFWAEPYLAPSVQEIGDLSADVRAVDIEAHVRFLASDELRGRETGSPEVVRAAHHLAKVFEAIGVEPAGDDGTYLQRVPIVRIEYATAPHLTVTDSAGEAHELTSGVDFSAFTRGVPIDRESIEIRIVRKVDDLPDEPNAKLGIFIDAKSAEKRAWLAEKGLEESVGWGMVVQASRNAGRAASRLPSPRLVVKNSESESVPSVKLKGPWRDRLMAGELTTLDLSWGAEVTPVDDFNVVGKLSGKGSVDNPKLADEVVVISAHYDHIGVRSSTGSEPDADLICNGADDDASGVAAVLEIAAALAKEGQPHRTAVFLLATGEEKGLLGTWHYIADPVGGLENTVANLNFEMIGRADPAAGGAGKLWLTGFERSNLGPACVERGIEVIQDPHPKQSFFTRSDNYAFVQRGIVGQTFSTYNLHEDYHRPSDEADTLDFEHMAACVRAGLGAVRLCLDSSYTPTWNEGEPKLR
ncbi:MAG: hypothetical protein ACI841_002919 [Planctomycetota bacterium]|jgi:hypothetical protein